MKLFGEELLEPVARYFRFGKSLQHIQNNKLITLADIGCGPNIRFYHYSKQNKINFKSYLGIDPLIQKKIILKYSDSKEIRLIKNPLNNSIPLKSGSVDYVVGFAFIEHIDNPSEIVNEAIRTLKPGGKAIFTTPTHSAKIILEFLSFKLGLISPREIREHKNYFNKKDLVNLISDENKKKVRIQHNYFEFRLNNLFVLEKK